MGEFKRRRKESTAQWRARLAGMDASALTPTQLDELTLRRLQAERAARRGLRRTANRATTDAALASDSQALLRCMELIRALSAEDRRRLLRWLEGSFDD